MAEHERWPNYDACRLMSGHGSRIPAAFDIGSSTGRRGKLMGFNNPPGFLPGSRSLQDEGQHKQLDASTALSTSVGRRSPSPVCMRTMLARPQSAAAQNHDDYSDGWVRAKSVRPSAPVYSFPKALRDCAKEGREREEKKKRDQAPSPSPTRAASADPGREDGDGPMKGALVKLTASAAGGGCLRPPQPGEPVDVGLVIRDATPTGGGVTVRGPRGDCFVYAPDELVLRHTSRLRGFATKAGRDDPLFFHLQPDATGFVGCHKRHGSRPRTAPAASTVLSVSDCDMASEDERLDHAAAQEKFGREYSQALQNIKSVSDFHDTVKMRERHEQQLADLQDEQARAQLLRGRGPERAPVQKVNYNDQEAKERVLCRLGLLKGKADGDDDRKNRRRLKGHDFALCTSRAAPVYFSDIPTPGDLRYDLPQWPPPASAERLEVQKRLIRNAKAGSPSPVSVRSRVTATTSSPMAGSVLSAVAGSAGSPERDQIVDPRCVLGRHSGRKPRWQRRSVDDTLKQLMRKQDAQRLAAARKLLKKPRTQKMQGPDPPTWKDNEYWMTKPERGGTITWKDDCMLSPQMQTANVRATTERRIRAGGGGPEWSLGSGRTDNFNEECVSSAALKVLSRSADAAMRKLPWRAEGTKTGKQSPPPPGRQRQSRARGPQI
eukprot:TRINITY_DN3227_c0_g2_i1.p1 TRINITY_DN3227_c0_g2~~TRINITY_DN3227_c0_g2_i1.p1  ORF type:complete len:696 (+),score=150.38 TRINITY_DN3227_c0_g2_i1:103-2088(+)